MTNDLADLLSRLLSQDPDAGARSSWWWGTVTAVAPLRVHLDCDTAELPITPDTLAVVDVGDRVWCQLYGDSKKKMVIHGKAV